MTRAFVTATPEQRDAIDSLMVRAFTPYVRKLGKRSTSGPYPWLEAAIARSDVYVGMEDAAIIGVVATTRDGPVLTIDMLGVDPARQGAGIGSWLFEEIERVARGREIETLVLKTAEIMSDLLRLYARHGFLETHRTPPAKGRDAYLRVHMQKRL